MLKLSVIIPTMNRADLLKHTLDSIESQIMSQNDFEIIIIDNGSSDNTKGVCDRFNEKNGNLRYFYDPRPGLHVGRNRGYRESKTDILVYADDDIVAFPTWLEAIWTGFQDPETVLIGGSNLPLYEGTPPAWMNSLWRYDYKNRCRNIDTHSIIDIRGKARRIDPGLVFGCSFSIRKKIIAETRGFHPDGMPDDLLKYRGDGEVYVTNYIRDNSMQAMFFPGATIWHKVTKARMKVDYVYKVSYRSGISDAYMYLRKNNIYQEIVDYGIKAIKEYITIRTFDEDGIIKKKRLNYVKGRIDLVTHYVKEPQIQDWVHRDNYLGDNAVFI